MRIFHVADSDLDLLATDVGPPGRNDLRAGFEHAVQAAIDVRADVFLHAGGLIVGDGSDVDHALLIWLTRCLSRLHAAGIAPVVHETGFALFGLDCATLPPGGAIEVGGAEFISGLGTPATQPLHIRCAYGDTPGMSGARPGAKRFPVDPHQLARCDAPYIAMAGTRRQHLVQPNACYSGATAPLDRFCTNTLVGLLVEIGDDTNQLLSITAVRLPNRKVAQVDVDASGMGAERLSQILYERIEHARGEYADWRTSVAAPPATSWVPRRPLLVVTVTNSLSTWEDVQAAEPRLAWLVEQELIAQGIVEFDGVRAQPMVPYNRAVAADVFK